MPDSPRPRGLARKTESNATRGSVGEFNVLRFTVVGYDHQFQYILVQKHPMSRSTGMSAIFALVRPLEPLGLQREINSTAGVERDANLGSK